MIIWLKAFRLRTLPLSMSGIITGSALAVLNHKWNTIIFILSLITTLFFQILSNLANDLGDHLKGTDNENRIGPIRTVQSGKISVKQMKIALVIFTLFSLISSITLIIKSLANTNLSIQLAYLALSILAILSAIFYTIGKNAYGYLGLGDIFVFIFFGLISVLGVFTLYTHFFKLINILPAISIGFLSVAVLNLNNMRDLKNDTQFNKKTLVVKMGLEKAKIYHLLLIILSFLTFLCYIVSIKHYILLFSLLPFFLLFKHIKFVFNTLDERFLDSQLKTVAINTFFISILFLILSIIEIYILKC